MLYYYRSLARLPQRSTTTKMQLGTNNVNPTTTPEEAENEPRYVPGKLLITYLHERVTDEDLREVFEPFGELFSCNTVPIKRVRGRHEILLGSLSEDLSPFDFIQAKELFVLFFLFFFYFRGSELWLRVHHVYRPGGRGGGSGDIKGGSVDVWQEYSSRQPPLQQHLPSVFTESAGRDLSSQ